MNDSTPMKLVRYLERQYPGIYDRIEEKVEENRKKVIMQDYVNPQCYQFFTNQALLDEYEPSYGLGMLSSRLTAARLWKQTKVVYEIDDRLAEELWEQAENAPDTEKIPADFLCKLPFDCIYVRSNYLRSILRLSDEKNDRADGFFAWVEPSPNNNVKILKFETCAVGMQKTAMMHMVLKKATIAECMTDDNDGDIREVDMAGGKSRVTDPEDFPFVGFYIQILLYIISAYNDQSERRKQQPKGRKGKVIRTDDDITTIDVGVVVGAKLRKADKEKEQGGKQDKEGHGSDKRKAPHMRRAHWHLYWVGSKENRHQELRWIHPVLVNADEVEDIPTKVTPVE